MIQYTSDTTGFPKGAVLSHRGLVNNARFYAARCGADATTTWINTMPMFHTSGCGMVTLGCLQAGYRMVLVSLFDANVVLDQLAAFKADIILGVPIPWWWLFWMHKTPGYAICQPCNWSAASAPWWRPNWCSGCKS